MNKQELMKVKEDELLKLHERKLYFKDLFISTGAEVYQKFESDIDEQIPKLEGEIETLRDEISTTVKDGKEVEMDSYTKNFLKKYVAKKWQHTIVNVDHDVYDGYFVSLTDDYIFRSTDCHTASAPTINDIKKDIRTIVRVE